MDNYAEWRRHLVADPDVSGPWHELVPTSLMIGGVERRRSRSIDAKTAAAFAARGRDVYLLAFDSSGRLPRETLGPLLTRYAADFEDDGPHPAESMLFVYGRRGTVDTRVVVVMIAGLLDGHPVGGES